MPAREAVMLSPADFAEIVRELEALRGTHRAEVAQLERLVASAIIVDAAHDDDGLAGLGSFVAVREPAGGHVEYEIVAWRSAEAVQTQVTPASPIGKALLGARAGDVIRVMLPRGRERTLEVVAVRRARLER